MRRLVEQTNECVNPGNNAGEIQKFLGINVDKTFGDETAEAVANYLRYGKGLFGAGGRDPITTRQALFNHMVKDYPNEFKGGIGPNAQKVIGNLLYAECQRKAKAQTVKKEYKPTVTRAMWGSIMKLWNHDPEMKAELLASVNKEIKKKLSEFSYNELECYSMTFKNIIKDVTFNPCMRIKASFYKMELTSIEQASDNWMRASGDFRGTGNVDAGVQIDSSLYGELDVLLKIEKGVLSVKLEDLDANLGTYFDLLIFEVKFRHNKVKLYNDFWCGGWCKSWSTPIEREAIAAVGTQTEDMMEWINKYKVNNVT